MNRNTFRLLLAGLLVSGAARCQLVEEFQPPRANCCLPAAAQALTDQLKDWNQLGRYHAANEALKKQPPEPRRVVFLGDSITDGWRLAESFPGKPYVNRGISGQTTPQMLLRFRQDVITLQPKAVVILAGTNDIAENTGPITLAGIEDNLVSMVDLAKRAGIRVILSALVPAAKYPWRPDLAPVEKIRALNGWIKDYAAREGLVFLDYHSAMANEQRGLRVELSEDGVHPNRAGYAVMAPLAEMAIAAALGRN
jgi:acyl-CoA thioesterase-1